MIYLNSKEFIMAQQPFPKQEDFPSRAAYHMAVDAWIATGGEVGNNAPSEGGSRITIGDSELSPTGPIAPTEPGPKSEIEITSELDPIVLSDFGKIDNPEEKNLPSLAGEVEDILATKAETERKFRLLSPGIQQQTMLNPLFMGK